MENSTVYPGPSPDDYANVRALNTAFLEAIYDFKGPQRGRFAAAPFLLFSLREDDPVWWEQVLADRAQQDLLALPEPASLERRELQSAALAFVWQLSRRNPYAVRVISGASVRWCEQLAELPLVALLARVGPRGDLLRSRLGNAEWAGSPLLDAGANSTERIRRSSHLVALQSLLTQPHSAERRQLASAACKMPGSRVRIVKQARNEIRGEKV